MEKCIICGGKRAYVSCGLCRNCYYRRPDQQACRKAYDQRPYVKEKNRINSRMRLPPKKIRVVKKCEMCDKIAYARGRCHSCYYYFPDQQAVRKAYRQRPYVKEKKRVYQQSLKRPHKEKIHIFRKCKLCDKAVSTKGLCDAHHTQLQNQKAIRKAQRESSEGKARIKFQKKIYAQRPEVKARTKVTSDLWKQSPAGIAWAQNYQKSPEQKARQKASENNPARKEKRKVYFKVYNRTTTGRAVHKKYKHSQKGRTASVRYKSKRRLYGNEIINPCFAGEPGFHGHHIDKEHVLFIPKVLHESIHHSLKNPQTMERINTVAFNWLLGGLII